MNVLFDASVIGLSRMDLNCRTGVFRYAENLVRGLVKHKEIPLSFSASEGFRPLVHLGAYTKEHPEFLSIPIVGNKISTTLFELLYKARPDKEEQGTLLQKVRRRLAWEGMRFIENHSNLISPASIEKIEIFHSPFWPIPKQIQENSRVKKFLTIHDLYSLKMTKASERATQFEQRLLDSLNNDDWVFCVSEATKRDFLELKPSFNPAHVLVSYESISDTFVPLSSKEKDGILSDLGLLGTPYFVSVGAIHERKNTAHLIRTFASLVRKRGDRKIRLVLVGPPIEFYTKQLLQMPEIKELGSQIYFAGFLEDTELAALYQGAKAFVYPSLYEGFGIPILEAMRLSCPVIASNNSSIPEVAGDAALLVPPTSMDELRNAMERLLDDPRLCEDLKLLGLAQTTKFTWDRCTAQTVEGYAKALAERS